MISSEGKLFSNKKKGGKEYFTKGNLKKKQQQKTQEMN